MIGDTNDKVDALAAELAEAVNAVDLSGTSQDVNVETEYRRASETGRNRGDQIAIFGDPVFYLEVLPAGRGALDRAGPAGGGAYRRRSHDLQVVLMYGYADAGDRRVSSQREFNDLMDAIYDAAAAGQLCRDGIPPQDMQVQEGTPSFTALDSRGQAIAHEMTFIVTLTDDTVR